MRKLSFILTIAMLIIAVIIIPVGISNVYLALQLGLVFECVSSIFFLCLFIAFCLFEVREFIRDYSWNYEEVPVEGMHDIQLHNSECRTFHHYFTGFFLVLQEIFHASPRLQRKQPIYSVNDTTEADII